MITNNDIAQAIAALVEQEFPGEPLYRDFIPVDFQRPGNLLELSGGAFYPNFTCGSVELRPQFTLTTFAVTDHYHQQDDPELTRRQMRLLGLFLPGYLRVGDRAPHVMDEGKYTYNKSPVNICGMMAEDAKVTSVKGTGSITVAKVYTRNHRQADTLLEGHDVRSTIIAKLDDPDAYGAERVALYNVSFDDETIMDFQHGQLAQTTIPFTFTEREWLDVVTP